MKTVLFSLIIAVFTIINANAQQDKSPLFKFLKRRGYHFLTISDTSKNDQFPDTIYYNTIYKAPLLGSPTIPFSFSSIDLSNPNFSLNTILKLGYGYTWFLGDFVFTEDDEIRIRQTFSFGVEADVDVSNSFLTGHATSSFVAGGFVGLQTFSLFAGYDFIKKTTTVGVITRIDIYTLFEQCLNPIGKVYEQRGHRRGVEMVKNNQY
jgi:hypothetical protein